MFRVVSPLLFTVCLPALALAQTDGPVRPPTALIHGNYCGMGNNAPLPPIDALDAACARHDSCVPSGRLPSRGCNLRLQWEAARIARDPDQPDDLRALAAFMATGAAMLPFDPSEPEIVVTAPAPAGYGRDPPSPYRRAYHAY
ncbi:hypothetical protein G3T14_14515 [Methylobacterium sp. BTF04]|nr:hypothetical protein [Methylobacterium sp. BTF04]